MRQAGVLAADLSAASSLMNAPASQGDSHSPSPTSHLADDDGGAADASTAPRVSESASARDSAGDIRDEGEGDGGSEELADSLLPARLVSAVAFDCLHRLFNASSVLSGVSKMLLR
jgi:hypothetical protein